VSGLRLRHVAEINPSTSEFEAASDSADVTFVPLEAVWTGALDVARTRVKAEVAQGYTRFREGDVLVPKITPTFEAGRSTIARGLLNGFGAGTTELHVVRPGPAVDGRYVNYLVLSRPFLQGGEAEMIGVAGQKRVPDAWLRDFRVPVTDVTEQRAIANFLDTDTARINALIAKKRRMIDLLDERWAAVCAHRTGMQGDGIRSSLVQLRRIADLQAGAAFPHVMQGDSSGTIPYVKVGDLSRAGENGYVDAVQNRVSPEVAKALRSPVLPAETIVLPKIGAALLTNRRAVLSEPSCLDQNVMGITVKVGSARYVQYCLESIDLGALSAPGPVPLLNEDVARSVRIPWPSHSEQDRIADDLERLRLQHRRVRLATYTHEQLLVEHRQALITAAVTGELEVSGVAA
jgi:type I restriction enzyme S subunit